MKNPIHLTSYISDIEGIPSYFNDAIQWFENLYFKAKITFRGSDKFKILFSGIRHNDGFITENDDIPLVIMLAPITEPEKNIILFDQRIHGYTPILIEKRAFRSPIFNAYYDLEGNDIFEIIFWTNSSSDFEDEFELNMDKKIKTLNSDYQSIEFLRNNAFDYMGILLKNKNGKFIKLTEIELM